MKKGSTLLLFFCLLSYALPASLVAQNLDSLLNNKRVYVPVNIGDKPLPKIDGILDDEIWSLGEWQGDFTQQQPVGGVAGSENTYVKVLYDYSNMFVAIICQDDEPELIRDIFDRRDALSGDMTGIAIDSYDDRRTAFEFNMSAGGQKMDLKHVDDYKWDFNWNAVWDGASARVDSGWVAEMRVPFSQMRYANKDRHEWGMHVWRWIERKMEEDQWQYIPLQAPSAVYLFGRMEGVENIRSSRQMEFLPYLSAGIEKTTDASASPEFFYNGGIDAKLGISSDFTLDLTINPDFGQVEADPSVMNLTSFETFYEEKRPFFLEGNDVFDFTLGEDIPYYSRRIGARPDHRSMWNNEPVSDVPNWTTILGAAKFTGKSNKGLSVGVMNGLTAQEFGLRTSGTDQHEIQVAPLTNYHASRVKKEFDDGNTIIGGIFSLVNRISPDSAVKAYLPETAVSGGLDFLQYWDNKNYYLEAKTLASQLRGSKEAILNKQRSHIHRFQRSDADYLQVDPNRETLAGSGGLVKVGKKGGKFNFSLAGEYRSPGVNFNDIGYIRQADFAGEIVELAYRMNEPTKWIRNYTLGFTQEAQWSFGGENTLNELGLNFLLRNNKLWGLILNYDFAFSHLDTRELRGGPAIRMDGEHQFGAMIMSNGAKDLSGSAGIHFNSFLVQDSHESMPFASITWLPIRRIKLSAKAVYMDRKYHQQYVNTMEGISETLFISGQIDQQTVSLTFRGELFISPEFSIQYYGSPFYSVGSYSDFRRVNQARAKDREDRFEALDVTYDATENNYSFDHNGSSWAFANPDFSFMEFRSNLVLRWEYKLGSTIYLVWAHDRSDWQGTYHPVSDISGDLFGLAGNNAFMVKVNFWFPI